MAEHKLKVIKKKSEAKDSVSLQFEIPPNFEKEFKYQAGQFIGLQADINDEKVTRSYSLSSTFGVDSFFQITLKKIQNGKMSGFLVDQVQEGDHLIITPPVGRFVVGTLDRHHILFAAGSGITPIYSMIKELLSKNAPKITLIYSNKDEENTIFKQELKSLESQYPNFSVKWVFSQKTPDWENVLSGRLSTVLLENLYLLWQHPKDPLFYMCGPEGFMESIEAFLGQKGYDGSQIIKESFVSSVSSLDQDEVVVGQFSGTQESCDSIKAEIDFEDCEVTPQENETVLEALLREGFDPPYSCMDGNCLACQCQIKEGAIRMEDTGMLTEEDYKEGRALSCKAYPLTKKLKIIYEF